MIPDKPEARLTRSQSAQALTLAGYPIKESTLATMAVRGGGPAYQVFGRKPIYTWSDLLAWAEGRTSKKIYSTSEMEAA